MNDSKLHPKSRLADHIVSLPKSGIRDFFELVIGMDDVISLGVGEPDFVTPWNIREAAVYGIENGHTSYTSNLGLMSLREEISRFVDKEYQISYDPATECIITVGVSEALDLVLRALCNPGDEVIYHEPCYVSYRPGIIMAGGVPVKIETREQDDFSLDPDMLKDAITDKTKAVLLNFPCNPTGATLTVEQMQAIADLAIKHNLIIIADEIYSELVYDGKVPSIASLPGMKERTVFLHGFSKAHAMTGFRVGYACGPVDIIDAMMKIHQYTMLCASIIGQEAAIEALKNGDLEKERMRKKYGERRNIIVDGLNTMGLTCFKPKGAFYAFPSIASTGLTSNEFATKLLTEHKVAVVPGTAFGDCGEGFVRCAYAASTEDIYTAMEKMKQFLAELSR